MKASQTCFLQKEYRPMYGAFADGSCVADDTTAERAGRRESCSLRDFHKRMKNMQMHNSDFAGYSRKGMTESLSLKLKGRPV